MNLVGRSYLAFKKFAGNRNRFLSRQEALTQQFLDEWQNHRNIDTDGLMQDLLTYASIHVPYYRHYFAGCSRRSTKELGQWPILTRQLLRDNFKALHTDVPRDIKTWEYRSGGSSGAPVTVVHDEFFAAKAQALRDLCTGIFFEGPYYNKLVLWGMFEELSRQKASTHGLLDNLRNHLRYLAGLKTTHINTFELGDETLRECVQVLKKQQPEFILGYAGSVYHLAKYIDEYDIHLDHRVEAIVTTAQSLYPFMREKIEQVFGCTVCDHYGSRETGPNAWQHRNGDMYFPKFFSQVEVVDELGEPCAPGEEGRILITCLHNFSMPIIRYDTGDIGVQGVDSWYCNYPFATLKSIQGRASEEFVRKDGSLVQGLFFITLFYARPWVKEFCVVQKDMSTIEIQISLKPEYQKVPVEDIGETDSAIREIMRDDTDIQWVCLPEIPLSKAGKHHFVRSEVRLQASETTPPPSAQIA